VVKPSQETNEYLLSCGTQTISNGIYLDQLLKRAELGYPMVEALAKSPDSVSSKVARQVEIEIKYEGYIKRQLAEIGKFKNLEKMRIPQGFDFSQVHGLSNELKEKLALIRPSSLGQASRLEGITPAAISVLMIAMKAASQ
jgi:tRNA uridine 5-carboxymethylaminomethyl modification enzyme